MEHTFSCLQNALRFFGGVPRKIIVDNFKGAVLRHSRHGEVRFNPHFLDFNSHYGTLPVACNVKAPYEKGIIENAIGYIKGNFISGSRFSGLEEAQMALRNWLDNIANVRTHGTTRKRPVDLFEQEEKRRYYRSTRIHSTAPESSPELPIPAAGYTATATSTVCRHVMPVSR